MAHYDFYKEASEILAESDNSVKIEDVRFVLEDATSPITNKYIENLYNQVVSKGHINFDDRHFYIDLVFYNYILKICLPSVFNTIRGKHSRGDLWCTFENFCSRI